MHSSDLAHLHSQCLLKNLHANDDQHRTLAHTHTLSPRKKGKVQNKIQTSRSEIVGSSASGLLMQWTAANCKMNKKCETKNNANGQPWQRWPFWKIPRVLQRTPSSPDYMAPRPNGLNGVCQGQSATAVTCEFGEHLHRLPPPLPTPTPLLQLITIT